ncbi:CGNR zinc finger domain-containing protein [Nocardioides sp. GXZ039]|uniref:CGNR zinc finger domain-containing protein n=1 Tax=Nocardioides sp. GXZ039 TaxID=3136018 RepID=UPI0030F49A81
MSTPWAVEVDGVRLPTQLSGHPALELCNSLAGWRNAPAGRGDYLRSYDVLVVLALTSGLIEDGTAATLRRRAAREQEEADAVLARTRALRADLYGCLTGAVTKPAQKRLASAIGEARARQRLDLAASPPRWHFGGSPTLADPLDVFLVAAGDLLVDDRRPAVGVCPGEDCGWLFLNSSGRRRWCQMAVCGNRSKQAAFAARRRA